VPGGLMAKVELRGCLKRVMMRPFATPDWAR
jgi:hypothetical protein